MDPNERRVRRRDVLAATGTVATVALAGCAGGDSDGTSPDGETPTGESTGTAAPTPSQQLPAPLAGNADAAVSVESFEDFACSHCATYSLEVLPQLWSEYVEPGDVRYEWYDLPIPSNPGTTSWRAASAARSVQANADADDAFWTYAELLFENQSSLSLDLYEELADEVAVDGATVRQAAEAGTYEPTVREDRQTGIDRGVQGTPTIFVDGEMVQEASYETISAAIDAALGNE